MPSDAALLAEDHARAAQLVYVSDEEPGFRRRRAGRGFYYLTPAGERLNDKAHLARIRALAIPPAYVDVWITIDPLGHLQATGRDDRGRKQYRYHERWHEYRDATKYGDLARFARLLPDIRERVESDLRRRSLGHDKVLASIVWMLDHLLIRIGNDTYAKQNKSFGLTTLKKRHLEISGAEMRFRFRGKSGKEWNLRHTDRRIARVIRAMHDLPGQHLFQYEDEDGRRRHIQSSDVNEYLREASGSELSSKLFRTWAGTKLAAMELANMEPPASQTAAKRGINTGIDLVAARLGNTRAVCRRCYVHPAVFEAYQAGTLAEEFAATRPARGHAAEWMDDMELRLVRWLEAKGANQPS